MAEEECDPAEWIEDLNDATEMADDVLDAASTLGDIVYKILPKYRQCSVQISNESSNYVLRNPRVHTDTGICTEPLAITINPASFGEGFFTKSPSAMRGSGGVFTYDVYHPQTHQSVGKVAALFKVPYDLNLKSVVFAIGLFDMETECDKHLFHRMFKGKQNTFVRAKANGSCITFQSNFAEISASMSNCAKAVLKIEVR